MRVEATIADVSIAASDRPDLTIDIERSAPSQADLDKYPVVVEARPDGLRVSIVQRNDGRDPRLRSRIRIAAPVWAVLEAVHVFEGRVTVSDLRAACSVDLQRGGVEANRLAGRVRLEVGLGSVDVRDAELTPGGMMRLRVFNGPVNVRFASAPRNARILAVTLNGRLSSDVPLSLKDRFGPRFGEATLGSGDPVLSIDVVKGDISIAVDKGK